MKTKNSRFYPMFEKPKPSAHDETYSEKVIIYELNPLTKEVICSKIGFYSFITEQWIVTGNYSMKLYCWAEIKSPSKFMRNKEWEVVLHSGY
jgi:hypothetical protein